MKQPDFPEDRFTKAIESVVDRMHKLDWLEVDFYTEQKRCNMGRLHGTSEDYRKSVKADVRHFINTALEELYDEES